MIMITTDFHNRMLLADNYLVGHDISNIRFHNQMDVQLFFIIAGNNTIKLN